MGKKLTLNIDGDLIEFAHQYSKSTHQSISHIVEKFFKELKGTSGNIELSKTTKALYGSLDNLDDLDKKDLRKLFHEKSLG